jgi:putative peptidoglycan lipid II flippase
MTQKLLKRTALVSCLTMVARFFGFARDIVLAQVFGAGLAMDAFIVAFKVPNFMRRLFAEGAFSQAFVPVLSDYKKQDDPQKLRDFISHMAGVLGAILLIVTVVVEIATPVLVALFAPGYLDDPERYALTSTMLHLTFPYLFFISLTALSGAVLNTFHRFAVPALTPILLNLCLITGALWVAPHMTVSVLALAWAVFFAGIVQLLFQLPFLYQRRLLVLPRFYWRDPGVQRVLKLMIPALFGVSVAQLGLLIDTFFASFLPRGSVTWLFLSDRITSLPLGVFGVAIATVILPHLSLQNSQEDMQQTTVWALRMVLFIGVPAALGLVMLADPLLVTLFQYNQFSAHDTLMVKYSLLAFAVGIPAFMSVKVLASVYYAQKNIATPVRFAVIALVCNIILNLLLIRFLAHAGLALATSIASMVNVGLLVMGLCQQRLLVFDRVWGVFFLQLLIAGTAMAAMLYWLTQDVTRWLAWHWPWRCAHLVMLIVVGKLTYFASLFIMKFDLKGLFGRVVNE